MGELHERECLDDINQDFVNSIVNVCMTKRVERAIARAKERMKDLSVQFAPFKMPKVLVTSAQHFMMRWNFVPFS